MALINLDAIHVVNLKHRTDRREETEKEIQKAVDAGIFPDIKPEFVNRLPPKGGLLPLSFGYSSFYQSGCEHQRIMEQLFHEKRDLSLILEDDVEWTPAFFEKFASFWADVQNHAPDWLALFLGGTGQVGRTPAAPLRSFVCGPRGHRLGLRQHDERRQVLLLPSRRLVCWLEEIT